MSNEPGSDIAAYLARRGPRERMSNSEWNQMRSLLIRFASLELDQFANWQIETPDGYHAYINVSVKPAPGSSPDHYDPMRELPDETGDGA